MILCVTGTSTGVGKTVATAALAAALAQFEAPVTAIKPAQTGFASAADRDADGLLSDASEIGRLVPAIATIEHRRFPQPLAPLTAARLADLPPLDRDETAQVIRATPGSVLVEGAGGVLVKLGVDRAGIPFTLLDIASDVGAAVVVVSSPTLGTLNHTELTVRAIAAAGVECAGIVLCRWPAEPGLVESCNLADLPELTGAPVIGKIPDGATELSADQFGVAAASWFDRRWLTAQSRR